MDVLTNGVAMAFGSVSLSPLALILITAAVVLTAALLLTHKKK